MSKLMCSLFGPPRVKLNGNPVNIKTRKGLAMLAYLASAGWAVEREVLASLLWPEHDDCRARANLRRTLFTLQQTPIADWFDADQFTVGLTPEAMKQIDLIQFDRLLATSSREPIKKAVSLYRGQFMAGFYLPDCDAFEEWLMLERERHERQFLNALDSLTLSYLVSGEYDSAVFSARKQLEIDNLREPAWRQLMAGLVGLGRRAEALVEFSRCRKLLENEVGLEPTSETLAFVSAIQQIDTPKLAVAGSRF